jgi:hypothetical protein
MSSIKTKLKELIFECDSEQEALDLLQNYRRKNFHLVSKKTINPADSTVALKLIKFRQSSNGANLETVWENFVNQMTDFGVENGFIVDILKTIRAKENFWEVHPEDHLRDILMDARNYVKSEELSKVFVFVAPEAELLSFFCAYQKSIASMIKSLGIFVMSPERLKSKIKELRVSAQVQNLPYSANSKISEFQKDIDAKVGLILATPEDLSLIPKSYFEENINSKKISLILSSKIGQNELFQAPFNKFLAGGYSANNLSVEAFSILNSSLKNKTPIAFLWNEDKVSSILNPEAQVLKILDDLLESQSAQHSYHR